MVYYPSNSIIPAQPSPGSKGSFGPVFIVLAVISVLAVGACIDGRLCSRRLSKAKSKHSYGTNDVGGDLEKGFEVRYPTMKPIGSSRAMIHDIEDGFEIKFPTAKPAWKKESQSDSNKHPQYGMPKDYRSFKYPANGIKQAEARATTFTSGKRTI